MDKTLPTLQFPFRKRKINKWNQLESAKLKDLVQTHGENWKYISNFLAKKTAK